MKRSNVDDNVNNTVLMVMFTLSGCASAKFLRLNTSELLRLPPATESIRKNPPIREPQFPSPTI